MQESMRGAPRNIGISRLVSYFRLTIRRDPNNLFSQSPFSLLIFFSRTIMSARLSLSLFRSFEKVILLRLKQMT